MLSPIRAVLTVLARVLLCGLFAASAYNLATNFNNTVDMMATHHVPEPKILLPGAIAFLALGSISVILGFRARIGALLLLVFLVLATYYFHNFWAIDDPQKKQEEMINAMRNSALMGAMLFIVANGPGPGSFDSRRATNRSVVTP
jgi:putative oxidoreductase